MKIKYFILIVLSLLYGDALQGAPYSFKYNERCRNAYQQYMSLHLEEGNAVIRQEIQANPYNLMATYISDYEDCLLLLFNGNAIDYEQRKDHMDERLDLIDNGDENSPWYRLCKAGIYLHWALVHVRFGENLKAATTFRKSYILVKENKDLFPDFTPNNIFLGLEEAVVGTVPDDYKWLASIFGMKGNVKKGTAKIVSFINTAGSKDPLREEAIIYYCYLKFYLLSQQEEVWNFVNSTQFPLQNNFLNTFVKANLAINYRKGEAALQALETTAASDIYRKFPIFDYEMGSALNLKLDPDAVSYFNRFLKRYQGKFFVKDSWQQIALNYYLQGNIQKANYSRAQIAKSGSASTDADKQAKRFGESANWAAIPVLKARLLIDGGYYRQALATLQASDVNSLSSPLDKLEYYFRLGRIYDELNEDNKAIQYYQTTINTGRGRKEHFAARSALQMAWIYERSGKIPEAIKRYNECLGMKGHDFQSNIDQQAKAGLNRLTQK